MYTVTILAALLTIMTEWQHGSQNSGELIILNSDLGNYPLQSS